MPILPKSANDIILPRMVPVTQLFPEKQVEDVAAETKQELSQPHIKDAVLPGQSVAVLVGSRGIAELKTIVRQTVQSLRSCGATPFIVPAMGSHGGGTAEGQRKILESYGVSEDFLGVQIKSGMDTVIIGETESGVPVHMDKYAFEADAIVPIARVKAHTDFKGKYESGLCKMLAIGCGKHNGCSLLHQKGIETFPSLIPQVAEVILEKANVPFGIAIIENALDRVSMVRAVPGKRFIADEPALLEYSKSVMAKLCFDQIDVLVVQKIGKEISGAGMDPNITGRISNGRLPGFAGPEITRIVVLELTEKSHGNAIGIGQADFTLKTLVKGMDFAATYANAIASCDTRCGFVPIMLDSEEEALRAAIQSCPNINKNEAKVVKIESTQALKNIQVSESLLPYCGKSKRFCI